MRALPEHDLDPSDPEFASINDFIEWRLDDDEDTFDWRHLQCLNARLGVRTHDIRKELEEAGMTLLPRQTERAVRGFQAWDNNRWAGNPCGGGSGWEQINGFAGQAG